MRHADRLRFLRGYLAAGPAIGGDWRSWWTAVARATEAKVAKNRRSGNRRCAGSTRPCYGQIGRQPDAISAIAATARPPSKQDSRTMLARIFLFQNTTSGVSSGRLRRA